MGYYYFSDKQVATLISSLRKNSKDNSANEVLNSLLFQEQKALVDQTNFRKAAVDKMTKIDVAAVKSEEFMVDDDAVVSSIKTGAYVQCWLWVDAETKPKRTKRAKA